MEYGYCLFERAVLSEDVKIRHSCWFFAAPWFKAISICHMEYYIWIGISISKLQSLDNGPL
jgi:hypothetical protein